MTGPKDAFPDLTDPTKLRAVKEAVKSALKLDNAYSLDNIQVWLQVEKDVPTPAPTRRLRTTDNKVCSAQPAGGYTCISLLDDTCIHSGRLKVIEGLPAAHQRVALPRVCSTIYFVSTQVQRPLLAVSWLARACTHGCVITAACCLQVYVVVLGYSLIRTEQLPPATELKTLMDAPELKGSIAEKLAETGFVTEEQLGRLQVCI